MPPARSNAARSAPRRQAPSRQAPQGRPSGGFTPRKVRSRAPLSRIRWDRAQRVALIAVLVLIGYLGVSGVASLISSHAQAEAGLATVRRLAATNRHLRAEEKALHQKSTILSDARSLGMVKKGEQSFIVVNH